MCVSVCGLSALLYTIQFGATEEAAAAGTKREHCAWAPSSDDEACDDDDDDDDVLYSINIMYIYTYTHYTRPRAMYIG